MTQNTVMAPLQSSVQSSPFARASICITSIQAKMSESFWKLVIDISAILILILSIAGYLLFFSLLKRKAISLWLTGLCFVSLVSLFIWGVV
jgi:hypothetical protein